MLYYIVAEHRRRKSQPSSLSPSASSEEDGGSGGYNNSDDEKISQQDGVDVLVSSLPASSQSRPVAQSTHTPHSLRSLPPKMMKKKRGSTDHSTHPMKSQVSRDSQNMSDSIPNVVSVPSINPNVHKCKNHRYVAPLAFNMITVPQRRCSFCMSLAGLV